MTKLSVPTGFKDIDANWVLGLVCHINAININNGFKDLKVISLSIHCQPNTEGVLSDICKVFIHVEDLSRKQEIVHNLFIKIIPHQFRQLVTTHHLFDREIAFYR
jgi:hypothetical protein